MTKLSNEFQISTDALRLWLRDIASGAKYLSQDLSSLPAQTAEEFKVEVGTAKIAWDEFARELPTVFWMSVDDINDGAKKFAEVEVPVTRTISELWKTPEGKRKLVDDALQELRHLSSTGLQLAGDHLGHAASDAVSSFEESLETHSGDNSVLRMYAATDAALDQAILSTCG